MNDTTNTHKPKKIVTHSGNFHTDDVFACAALSLLHGGNVEIVRSRDPEVWATGDYVVDVGGVYDHANGRYDHHQEGGAGAREQGAAYSSLGLVWKHYGEQLTGSASVALLIDRRFVEAIDLGDNGVETFTTIGSVPPLLIHEAINVFRPAWNEDRTDDEGFFEVFTFAKRILEREILIARAEEEGRAKAEEAYQASGNKQIIIIEGNYPWDEVLAAHPEPLFVVKPHREGVGFWKVNAVRDNTHSFKNRKDLPKAWAGKRDQELAEISGVPDALFCHNKLFVAGAASKEGAIALAEKAIQA